MEIGIAIFGLVGLVWLAVLIRWGGLFGCSLAVLATGLMLGYDFFHRSVLTIDRVLLGVSLIVWVVQAVHGRFAGAGFRKADLWMLLFLGHLTVSTLTHDWRIDGAAPAARLVFFFGLPAAFYLVARCQPLTEAKLRTLCLFFAGIGVYLGLTAVAEQQQLWPLVYPTYIRSPKFEEFFGRGRGPLLNPVANGLWLSAALSLTLAGCWRASRPVRVLGGMASLVMLAGIAATLTRSVWAGAAGVLFWMALAATPRRFRLPVCAGGLAAAALVGILSWPYIAEFRRDKFVSAEQMGESASLRPILATVALKMFRERPILGFGLGQYRQHHTEYTNERTFGLPLEKGNPYIQHNTLLSLLVETGFIGGGIYLVLIGLWIRSSVDLLAASGKHAFRRYLGLAFLGFLVAYGANSLLHELNVIPMTNMLLFFLAGLVEASAQAARGGAAAEDRRQQEQTSGSLEHAPTWLRLGEDSRWSAC